MLPSLQITNYRDGEVLCYPLAILSGKIKLWAWNPNITTEIFATANNRGQLVWPVNINRHFKAVIQLRPGENIISLQYSDHEKQEFKLHYAQNCKKLFVRLVYIVCWDGNGHFQDPENKNNSVECAKSKLCLAAQLVQSIMAEKLMEHGLARRTFMLEENEDGEAVCHVFLSKLTTEHVHQMSQNELWNHFAHELVCSELSENGRCKFLAFLSATRYECPPDVIPANHVQVLEYTKGHVALGGGGLALFGTGCLYTWASSLAELKERLLDRKVVDRTRAMDDSCNRGTYWACYASGLGATLHELAHTFDLGHSQQGIMGLGFHEICRELLSTTLDECCICPADGVKTSWIDHHKIKPKVCCSNCGDGCFWTRSQSLMLFFHNWFQPCSVLDDSLNPINVKGSWLCFDDGFQLVEIRDNTGMYLHHSEHMESLSRRVDLKSLLVSVPARVGTVTVVVQARNGKVTKYEVDIETATVLR